MLICIESMGIGGKERQAIELIKGLACKPELDCHVVCLVADDFYLNQLDGLAMTIDFAIRRVRWDVSVFYRLYRTIQRFRPNVIHTNGLMSSFYATPLARLMCIPLINGSIRNAFSRGGLRWRIEKMVARLADYRVANSYAGLRSRGFREADATNIVIYNGFDFSRVERVPSRNRLQCARRDGGTKIVGMVAEFSRLKDYPRFIQMARQLSARRRDVVFVAVGDGETLQACRQSAADVVTMTFLGQRTRVEEIIETFDIGVLATFTEGISNSIMEYMAFRKPVVATDGGGTRELVVDGETGFVVPSQNATALAAKVEYLLDNPEIAKRMGEAGEARLQERFSAARMVEDTVHLYKVAVAESKGHRDCKSLAIVV